MMISCFLYSNIYNQERFCTLPRSDDNDILLFVFVYLNDKTEEKIVS